jgi:hypothetical protein
MSKGIRVVGVGKK